MENSGKIYIPNNNDKKCSFYEMSFRVLKLDSLKNFYNLYQKDITLTISEYFEKLGYSKNLVNIFNWNWEESTDNSDKFRFQINYKKETFGSEDFFILKVNFMFFGSTF